MGQPSYDVIIVGYGPVSASLALMLGRRGVSVGVIERWKTRYPLPRAVCVDHELFRVLSANGMGPVLPDITEPGPLYQWFNADWKELLTIDWSAPSISGGPEVNFVHQPTLESSLDDAVRSIGNVDLHLGCDVVEVEQSADHAYVDLKDVGTGDTRRLSARYVVGCDGANSIVRDTIGGAQIDKGFEADWLVIDVLLKEGVTIEKLGIPAAAQYCNPERPTTIVPAGVREGRTYRRWEFMRLPGERNEDLESEEKVWEFLRRWAGPDDIELVRHKIYNFRSLLAERWRDGRLLIAGDAAHVMPPFMGQGMCSGMRDAWNLAWKLPLVLDGSADSRLLDTYQTERLPHVSQLIDLSIYLGKVICIPDAEEAAKRDHAFFSGEAEPPPPFPSLTTGLLHRTGEGSIASLAGQISPHVDLQKDGETIRFDDAVDGGFALVVTDEVTNEVLEKCDLGRFVSVDMAIVRLGADDNAYKDADGRFEEFMRKHDLAAVIVRPDFYIYGTAATSSNLASLLNDLAADLPRHGVRLGSEVEANRHMASPSNPTGPAFAGADT